MTPFTTLTSLAAPLLRDNIDTDTIIPSREITSTAKTGLSAGLFAPWRYLDARARVPDPAFVLNQPVYAGAQILLGGANFGCGSSREHAVWALAEYGIRAILAPGFAPIFQQNCTANGLAALTLPAEVLALLAGQRIIIDLAAQTVHTADGVVHGFAIDPHARAQLLTGLDAIALTLTLADAVAAHEARDRQARAWAYL